MTEKVIHQQICDYLKLKYPDVIFTSDASGMKTTIGLAMEIKRKKCAKYKIPDLLILQPNKFYFGLFLEIKKSNDCVFTRKQKVRICNHIQQQHKTLVKLRSLGYYAAFGLGFEDAKTHIDNYFANI